MFQRNHRSKQSVVFALTNRGVSGRSCFTNMYCLRRASSRLLPSSLASNAATTAHARCALPIQTTTSFPTLSPVPCHSAIQTRWKSSRNDDSNPQSPYSKEPTNPTVATSLQALSKRELRHKMLDNKTHPPSETIYVGNLFFDLTAEQLRSKMEEFGIVISAMIVFDSRGISKGFGYVQFSSIEEATKAVEGMHLKVLEGRQMVAQYARGPIQAREDAHPPSTTVFIGSLPFSLTDRDLQDLFKDIHGYHEVRFPVDRRSGLPIGYAHADFYTVEQATQAVEVLRRKWVQGRKLRVGYSDTTRVGNMKGSQSEPERQSR